VERVDNPHKQSLDEMDARIARFDAMIERAKDLPSWPTLAAQVARLVQAIATLTARVEALEQEYEVLRQRELLRLWEHTSPAKNGRDT
jgi:uncharacterized small protein (DUF1192 family)